MFSHGRSCQSPPQDRLNHHPLLRICSYQIFAESVGLLQLRVKDKPCPLSSHPLLYLGTVRSYPLTPAQQSQAGYRDTPAAEQQEEYYSSEVCGFLYRYDCCCNISHFTCTKCFMPVLKIVAQVLRHLFHICCAYECKHWSLKVIFTNVLTVSEFCVLIYHQSDTSSVISAPCFKANCNTLLV